MISRKNTPDLAAGSRNVRLGSPHMFAPLLLDAHASVRVSSILLAFGLQGWPATIVRTQSGPSYNSSAAISPEKSSSAQSR